VETPVAFIVENNGYAIYFRRKNGQSHRIYGNRFVSYAFVDQLMG
jgi:TPP-dependent pyruvate/acetoin dehydrogenase alpha subunit